MRKTKKKLLGLIGLALVALMTVVAYLLPSRGAYAESSTPIGVDHIRVTVVGTSVAVSIDNPETDYLTISPILNVNYSYQNSSIVEFSLSYEDDEGNTQVDTLPKIYPTGDETVAGSGTKSLAINLKSRGLSYGRYVLNATSEGPDGSASGDSIEFIYNPFNVEEVGTDDKTNDPIVDIDHDEDIGKIEIMPVDEDGNPLFDEPIVIIIEPDEDGNYPAGTETITIPLSSYGLPTGDYDLVITAYGVEKDPDTGAIEYNRIKAPVDTYEVSYEQKDAPVVPNTGHFTDNLNLAKSDIIITSLIAFSVVAIFAFALISRKKKDYRKNIRGRK